MATEARSGGGGFQTILVVACILLSALVLALAWQNRSLKAELADAHRSAVEPAIPADALKEGDRFEALDLLVAPTNAPAKLAFDGTQGTTLLLVFSSTCPACQETFPIWNDLAATLPGSARVVGLQSDLAAAGPVAAVRFPIHGFDGARPEQMARVPFVPCTVVIAADGTIVKVIFGVPTAEQREEIATALAS